MLVRLRNPFEQIEAPVTHFPFVMGRAPDCDLRSDSPVVSRRHCELLADESGVMVRDLGSRNGTYVDGERVTGQRPLADGNVLALGPIAYKVLITDCIGEKMLDRFRRALPSRLPRIRQPVEP